MAEFCLDCWIEINEYENQPYKLILSKELDICEECGCFQKVVVGERKFYLFRKLAFDLRKKHPKKDTTKERRKNQTFPYHRPSCAASRASRRGSSSR